MTLKFTKIVALVLLIALAAAKTATAAEKAAEPEKPVATVNNIAIPQARLDLNLKAAAQQGQPDSPELRKQMKEELIDLELIAQEARKKGLDKQPEVGQIIEVTKQQILRNAFVQDYIKTHPVAEDKLKQIYESQKTALAGKKEYKIAHILVDSEKEAQGVAALLKNKGDFGKIAKEKSKDPESKGQGGELGWTNPAVFAPPFGEVMSKLNKGQISVPVKTQLGWHVIKLEDVRDFVIPPYEKVKANLEKRLQQTALQETVKALRANAKIN
ncbi:MAG: peptidylprolyl isomerase [Desulfobulbaceae bacterium]|nr:peptidylprolyl isomerase [Desulfobulbaceae bacterium]